MVTGLNQDKKTKRVQEQVDIETGRIYDVTEPLQPVEVTPKPLIEPLPPAEFERQQQDEFVSLIKRIYPEKFQPGITSYGLTMDELVPTVIEQTWKQAAENTEAFLEDLLSRAAPEDAEALLQRLGATPEDMDQIFGVEERQAQVDKLIKQSFPEHDIESLAELVDKDFSGFVDQLRTGGRSKEKQDLLQTLDFEWADINEIFRVQKVEVPVDGVMKLVNFDEQSRNIYDDKGEWLGTYNPATKEFEAKPQESIGKDILDFFQYSFRRTWEQGENFMLSVVPNLIYPEMPEDYLGGLGKFMNETNKQMRENFRWLYAENKAEYNDWLKKNPEVAPNIKYQEGIFQNPELVKDPMYYAYELINMLPFIIASVATTAATGGVGLPAVLATAAVMTPIEGQAVYEDLINAGAPEDIAPQMALVAGGLIGLLESAGRIPLLKQVSPLIFKQFKRQAAKELVNRSLPETVKRFGRNYTINQFAEISTEVAQEVVGNIAVRVFDENRSIIENLPDIAAKTAIAMIGPGALGAGVSVRADIQQAVSEGIENLPPGIKRAITSEKGGIKLPGKPEKVTPEVTRTDLLPEGWSIKVIPTNKGFPLAEVNWADKTIRVQSESILTNPRAINHEVAHILIESHLSAKNYKSFVDAWRQASELPQKVFEEGSHIERMTEELGEYISGQQVDKKVSAFFQKYFSEVTLPTPKVAIPKAPAPEVTKGISLPRPLTEIQIEEAFLDADTRPKFDTARKTMLSYFQEAKKTAKGEYLLAIEKREDSLRKLTYDTWKKEGWEEVAIPKAEVGMPEAGLQPEMFGAPPVEVRPKGKGEIVQISMEDQLKLEEARRAAEIEGLKETLASHPARALIGLIKRTGKMKGEMPNLTIAEYKRLTGKESVSPNILTPDGKHVRWEYGLDEIATVLGYPDGESLREGILEAKGIKDRIAGLESGEITPAEEISPEVISPEEVVAEVPPPTVPPSAPPQSVTPPSLPVAPRPTGGEITRIITQSQEQVRQDKQNTMTGLFHRVPGIKQLLEFEHPGLKMTGENEKVLVAMVAENAARSDVSVWAAGTRYALLKDIKKNFGKDALRGGKTTDTVFLGTDKEAGNSITSTLKDIADNPELYVLTTEQRRVLADIEARNDQLLDWVVSQYNAEIGHFQAKEGGAFLPNVDVSEDVVEYLGSEIRAVTLGRGKTRVWQTARERMAHDPTFKPETDIQKLVEGLDNFKASAAASMVYKESIGGLTRLEAMKETHPKLYERMMTLRKKLSSLQGSAGTIESNVHKAIFNFLNSPVEGTDLMELRDNLDVKLKAGIRKGLDVEAIQNEIAEVRDEIRELRPMWEAANLKPYVFLQEGLFRYFPAEQANLIRESRRVSTNPALDFVERWRGQAFSGDFSPFAVQGVIGVLADPWGSLKAGIGGIRTAIEKRDFLRSIRIEALADDIANNPYEWSQFASLVGRGLTGTPKEYAAGFLSKLPGFDRFTESTFITVTRGSFNLWQRTYKNMVKQGIPELEAKVTAADLTTKVYPLVSAVRLGQSQQRHAFLRALPTSYSFIRQPASLVAEAINGFGKIMLRQGLTAQESLAVKTVSIGGATTMAVCATSAALSAMAKGGDDDDVKDAIWDAINPAPWNGKFLSVIVGNIRIPLGGPYRAIFRAIFPQEVKGSPIPLPFVGLPNYLKNRVSPAIGTQLDLLLNKDWSGKQIIKGDFPENIVRFLAYEFEGFLPLTAGAAVEAVRQGERYKENLAQQMIGQFMGVNPITLDNTYLDRQIRQLGLQKDTEPKPYSIQEPDIYNTKDLWGDAGFIKDIPTDEIGKRGFDNKIVALREAMDVKAKLDIMPNESLIKMDADKFLGYYNRWLESGMTDELRREFGDLSHSTIQLLLKYHSQKDEATKAKYLEGLTDEQRNRLTANPHTDWLKSHPKENAQLAVWGQAKILSMEAYNQFKSMVKALDIPDNALPDLTLPPDKSAQNYFDRLDAIDKYTAGSAEADLILAKDEDLQKWLKLDKPEFPVRYYELKVKNRPEQEYWQTITDKDSPDYIPTSPLLKVDLQKEAFAKKFPKTSAEYWDDEYRTEAIAKKFTDTEVEDWVERGRLVNKYSGNSPKVKEWAFDNPDAYRKALEQKMIEDKGGLPTAEDRGHYEKWVEPAIRLQSKNIQEQAYWDELGDKSQPDKYIKDEKYRREVLLKRFPKTTFFDDLERIEAYKAGFTDTEANLWAGRGQTIAKFEPGSAEARLWLVDHPLVWEKALDAKLLTDDGKDWNIPAMRIDVKYRKEDAEYDAFGDEKSPKYIADDTARAKVQAEYLADNPIYRIARRQRGFYHLDTEEKSDTLRDKYVSLYELPDKGYQRERYLLENQDLETILTDPKIMGDNVRDKVDPTKIPDRRYDELYMQFQPLFEEWEDYGKGISDRYIADEKDRQKARDRLTLNNPAFQRAIWGQHGYLLFIGQEKYVPDYVGYYQHTTDNPKPATADYWFEDDWYLMDHPEFYKAMTNLYIKTEGKQGWKPGERNFSKIPPKDIYQQYLVYDAIIGSATMSRTKARQEFRRRYPRLDAWLVIIGAVSKPIEQIDKEAGMTEAERIGITLSEKRLEIDRLKDEINRKLRAMAMP